MNKPEFGPCGLDDYFISKEFKKENPDKIRINGHYPLVASYETAGRAEGEIFPSIVKWAARMDPDFILINAIVFSSDYRARGQVLSKLNNDGIWTPPATHPIPFTAAPVAEAHFGQRHTGPLDMGIRAILSEAARLDLPN